MDWIKRLTLTLARNTARSDLAQNLIRDLKSMRALWNWIYMALYVWICVWSVLRHPDTIPTVITVTGGVVSVIFSGYVLSRTYEKIKNGGNGNGHPHNGEGNGASD
jgi:hypothetical protein